LRTVLRELLLEVFFVYLILRWVRRHRPWKPGETSRIIEQRTVYYRDGTVAWYSGTVQMKEPISPTH
jgi:hypothetical protein